MSDERATRLAEIRARVAAATPGPWRQMVSDGGQCCVSTVAVDIAWVRDEADTAFIAHSREDVEWLLGELDRTRTALAGLLGGVTTEQAAGCREVIHTERAWQEGVAAMLGRPRESEVTIEGGVGE